MRGSAISKIWSSAAIIAVFAILGIASSCSKSDTTNNNGNGGGKGGPGENEVWIQNFAFNPATITVPVNTTVKWTNKDGVTHTVTSDAGIFNSGNLGANATFSYKFTAPGSYPYKCTIHTYMTGTVIVN